MPDLAAVSCQTWQLPAMPDLAADMAMQHLKVLNLFASKKNLMAARLAIISVWIIVSRRGKIELGSRDKHVVVVVVVVVIVVVGACSDWRVPWRTPLSKEINAYIESLHLRWHR